MIDQDDWQLGDDAAGSLCSACGSRIRSGQARCPLCGARQVADPAADQLRALGEVMAGDRLVSGRRPRTRRHERRWLGPAATVGVLVLALAAYQLARHAIPDWQDRGATEAPGPDSATWGVKGATGEGEAEAPLTDERQAADKASAGGPMPPHGSVPAVGLPRVAEPAAVGQPVPETRARVEAPLPDQALVRPTSVPSPAAAREVSKTHPPESGTVTVRRQKAAAQSGAVKLPGSEDERQGHERAALGKKDGPLAPAPVRPRPLREKPSLGTELVEARRAYAAAIERYNGRADAYNAIADVYERSDAGADDEEIVHLRQRLEQARLAAESARAEAEELRRRLEEIQARYR